MATENIFVAGKAKWPRLVKPNQWGDWSITLYPNTESLETIRELQAAGLKNTLKKDEDGYYIQFKRPPSKKLGGVVKVYEPPACLDKEGRPMDGMGIGNGSDVTIGLEVYEHSTPGGGRAKAARLKSVRVDYLIPHDTGQYTEEEMNEVKEMLDQPKPIWG